MSRNGTFFVALITVWTSFASAQTNVSTNAIDKMTEILAPFVKTLDRDAWTFRYEARDSFSPRDKDDLKPRIANWANRFWNVDIQSGADVGPGVYVATDPIATATWGRVNPSIFAIKIRQGTTILMGDQFETPPQSLQAASVLSKELSCGRSSTSMEWSISSIVGFFRMNEKRECREVVVEAFRRLSLQALSYGFNSVALKGCRTTGTAISIVDSRAASLEELNWYSEEGNIEARPDVTPFIKALYFEALPDLYSQSLIANRETLGKFRRAYGFFDGTQAPQRRQYLEWRNSSILKCGTKWSVETEIPPHVRELLAARKREDPEIRELLIQLSVVYRERYGQFTGLQGVPAEFRIHELRALRSFPNFSSQENLIRYSTAQAPNWTDVPAADRQEYLKILQGCLRNYADDSKDFLSTVASSCGVEPEK